VYRHDILPIPPDFSDGSYGDFSDADYFWRISEGVPWTAMPVWKLRYSEEDRWALVYYIRVNFTQTLSRPSTSEAQVYPDIFLAQTMPHDLTGDEAVTGDNAQLVYAAPDPNAGKAMFTAMCAHCHGLSGLGDGWDGAYLDVKPANFTSADVQGLSDGDWFARVSYGLQNSAMPSWGEWMPLQNRWNVIAYIQSAITQSSILGSSQTVQSVYNDGQVAVQFAQVNTQLWQDEGHSIDLQNGANLYDKFCTGCHGADGQGLQPDSSGAFPGGLPYPSALPTEMPFNYVFWRIWAGVPDTRMGPFSALMSEGDIFDLASYLTTPESGFGGSMPQATPTPQPGG
jgi:mono/diheme cytochrome c family protein